MPYFQSDFTCNMGPIIYQPHPPCIAIQCEQIDNFKIIDHLQQKLTQVIKIAKVGLKLAKHYLNKG